MNEIIIIGGGAAGMMSAIIASKNGSKVTLLERNDRVGKKILATGNGRCNYTNRNLNIENYHGSNPRFAYSALSQFDVDRTIDFFERIGITPAVEDGGKVFPLSFQASSVLDVLRYEMDRLKVEVITEAFVKEIKNKKGKFGKFTVVTSDNRQYKGHKVIVATGGMALPNSGSDGNGYDLLKKLGHSIVDISPGLVQLQLEGDYFKQMTGVRVVGQSSLIIDNKEYRVEFGDLLFTNYGISGPPILQISSEAIKMLKRGSDVYIKLSLINKSHESLFEYLLERFSHMGTKTLEEALVGFLNKKLILPIIKTLELNKDALVCEISKEDIKKLSLILTDWRFKLIGSRPWADAQITVGGVNTSEIDQSTMESKLVDGVYIIGELLDINGDCGGFNLQWAWSSAYVAAMDASYN